MAPRNVNVLLADKLILCPSLHAMLCGVQFETFIVGRSRIRQRRSRSATCGQRRLNDRDFRTLRRKSQKQQRRTRTVTDDRGAGQGMMIRNRNRAGLD